jgi:hypothetical protein
VLDDGVHHDIADVAQQVFGFDLADIRVEAEHDTQELFNLPQFAEGFERLSFAFLGQHRSLPWGISNQPCGGQLLNSCRDAWPLDAESYRKLGCARDPIRCAKLAIVYYT